MGKRTNRTLTGRLAWNPGGYAFVDVEGLDEGVYVTRSGLGGAMPGDTVEVVAWSGRKGLRGRVSAVVERKGLVITGRYVRMKGFGVLEPHVPMPYRIIIPDGASAGARDSEVVSVVVEPPAASGRVDELTARVRGAVAFPEGIGDDLKTVSSRYGLSWTFPPEVAQEALEASRVDLGLELSRRVDLRDRVMFTIDGSDARDFDDAVGFETIDRGNVLVTVAIADVSHVVRPGGALDREARRRGFSVYFPETCIPMLPEVLSSGAMSLMPGADRLAVCLETVLGPGGDVLDSRAFEAVVRSSARLTYEAVGPFLEGGGDAHAFGQGIASRLKGLDGVCRMLRERRLARGSLDIDAGDIAVRLTDRGDVHSIERTVQNAAHRLVEEAMLLANKAVRGLLADHPAIFRVHEPPSRRDLMGLAGVLKEAGFEERAVSRLERAAGSGTHIRGALQAVVDLSRGSPLGPFVQAQVLKSLRRAHYSSTDTGHFGLAFDGYLHFTSPIRRYPDLLVHRALKGVLHRAGRSLRTVMPRRETLAKLAQDLSRLEELTDAAMRDAVRLKAASFMASHVGDDFDAVITGIKHYGMFVEVSAPPVEGLVRAEDQALPWPSGRSRGGRARHCMGERVRVRLVRADRSSGRLDFVLVNPGSGGSPSEGGAHGRHAKGRRGAYPYRTRRRVPL
jgi:ribonuclease R